MSQDLLKIFEKYRLGNRAMLCLWVNGHLNPAIRERSRILELQDRLKVRKNDGPQEVEQIISTMIKYGKINIKLDYAIPCDQVMEFQ